MIDFGHDKLHCDRKEWECYHHTPDHIIDEVNALVYAVIKTNDDPVVAQKIIYDTLQENGYGKYGFRDSEGDACTTRIINQYYNSNIDRWADLNLKAERKGEKWIHNNTNSEQVKEQKPKRPITFTSGQLLDIISALEEVENSLYDEESKHLAVYYMNLASQFHRMYDKLQALPGEKRVAQLSVFEE